MSNQTGINCVLGFMVAGLMVISLMMAEKLSDIDLQLRHHAHPPSTGEHIHKGTMTIGTNTFELILR